MKVLLDENLPVRLKYRFSDSLTVSTVSDEGWNGVKDGELMNLMKSSGFDILVTTDKGIGHQQNLSKHGIAIILLLTKSNRYSELKAFVPQIEKELPLKIKHGVIEINSRT